MINARNVVNEDNTWPSQLAGSFSKRWQPSTTDRWELPSPFTIRSCPTVKASLRLHATTQINIYQQAGTKNTPHTQKIGAKVLNSILDSAILKAVSMPYSEASYTYSI